MVQATVISQDVVKCRLERKNGKTILTVKIASEIESLFKASCNGDIRPITLGSNKFAWYAVTDNTAKFRRWANKYHLNIPNRGLDADGMYNFSFLFIQGSSGENGAKIEFSSELYSREQLIQYMQEFEDMVKQIYAEFISDLSLESTLSIKMVKV